MVYHELSAPKFFLASISDTSSGVSTTDTNELKSSPPRCFAIGGRFRLVVRGISTSTILLPIIYPIRYATFLDTI